MMKIAVLAPHYSEYSIRLAMALQESGSVSVLLLGRKESFGRELTRELASEAASKLKIRTFPSESRVKDMYMSAAYLACLAAFRPDVILAPELGHWNYTPMLRVASRIAPVGLIVHDPDPHSGDDAEHSGRLAPRLAIERNLASFFVVHGGYCEDRLRVATRVGSRPIINISHGPIIMGRAPKPMPSGEMRLLLFGRMKAYKGLEVFLDALDLLHGEGLHPHVTIAGRGPELARLAGRLQSDAIELINDFIEPERAVTLFEACSCLIAPYLDATQSGVIAASLANGRPVIASDVGALGEVVEHGRNGLLVKPNDPAELAAAMKAILTEPALFEGLAQGARDYARRVTWKSVAEKMIDGITPVLTK